MPSASPILGPIGHGRTNDAGRFAIGNVPAGTYRASASTPTNGSNGAVPLMGQTQVTVVNPAGGEVTIVVQSNPARGDRQ